MKPMLNLEDVTVILDGRVILDRITFRVDAPSFLAIIGPNGAGKTTLLKTILGIVKPVKGRVEILGIDVLRKPWSVRRLVGYVPQGGRIDKTVPILVKDVVLMGRSVKRGVGRRLTSKDIEAAKKALDQVGLLHLWDEPFQHLSGGQQQRVLIARAFAADPRLLVLDEPLVGVDATSQEKILEILQHAVKNGVGVVMVTHDINPVMDIADHVLLLNRKVIGFGKPSEQAEPELLSATYGRPVEVIRMGGTCYIFTGESHA